MMKKKPSDLTLKASQTKGANVTGRPVTWVQISLAAAEDLRALMKRQRQAAELVLALVARMRPSSGGVVVVSRQTMAELLDTSMSSVERALRVLIAEGWVQRIKIGGAHALAINRRVAWIGSRGDIQHAVFDATVIASRSEQDDIALAPPPIRAVPTMLAGELPLPDGAGLDPPSQPELAGIPPVVATSHETHETDQQELERRGQRRLLSE